MLLSAALCLASCGFEPVYSKKINASTANPALQQQLLQIDVKPINMRRSGQILRTHLQNLFNPTNQDHTQPFALTVVLSRHQEDAAMEQDREITRYNIHAKAEYVLTNKQTGERLTSGESTVTAGYDAVASDFATYTVEEDTFKRLLKQLALDLRFRLSSHFLKAQD